MSRGLLGATGALMMVGVRILHPVPALGFEPKDLKVILEGRDCAGCDLSNADLIGRDLSNINLSGANLSCAKLSMASLRGANLSRADLRKAELATSFLFGANLNQSNLSQAILDGAYLHQANLEDSNLTMANLNGAYLFDANLKGADLQGAKLGGTNLSGANLEHANFDQTHFEETIYDKTTRFPASLAVKSPSWTTNQPKSDTYQPPSRTNALHAEIHQLALVSMALTMGAADAHSYGGCKDRSCFDLPISVNERLVKLTREAFGEKSQEHTSALFSLATLTKERGKSSQAETDQLAPESNRTCWSN